MLEYKEKFWFSVEDTTHISLLVNTLNCRGGGERSVLTNKDKEN